MARWPRQSALLHAVSGAHTHESRGRALLALFGIVLGVALGTAVHLVNHSAKHELTRAMHGLAGLADLVVRGARGGFSEEVYADVARHPGVEAASPAVEAEARVEGSTQALRVLGIDPLRALRVQPALLGGASAALIDLVGRNAALLSAPAARRLGLRPGDTLALHTGREVLRLRIAAIVPVESYPQPLAILDIATVQWRFDRLGSLHRIDLRLAPGAAPDSVARALGDLLPAGVHAVTPDHAAGQSEQITRAHRVNLDMLALVALFTGAVLVYSTQSLAAERARVHLAVLRALGMTRLELLARLVLRSVLAGAAGAGTGVALGMGMARLALGYLHSDLTTGYAPGLAVELHVEPWSIAAFFVLGVVATVAGGLAPAVRSMSVAPAIALRPGLLAAAAEPRHGPLLAGVLLPAAALSSQAPAIRGLPVFGYLSIGLLLVGSLALLPALSRKLAGALPPAAAPIALLAFGRLRASPRHVTLSLAAILTSFSLMVAMLIMTASFRGSLERWLADILPADLYVRGASLGRDALLSPSVQAAVALVPGVSRVQFVRHESVVLAPDRPALAVVARDLPEGVPDALPLVGPATAPTSGGPPPAWVSEAVRDLHGIVPGDRITLPLQGRPIELTVRGVWRDYARQGGAVVIDRQVFVAATGDHRATDAWIWLAPDASVTAVATQLRDRLQPLPIELHEPAALRAASLRTFDRTFAVTYLLELAAVLIGMLGVSTAFGADALARRAEHGVLRHLGLRRRDVQRMLAVEGALIGAAGVIAGLLVGWLVSLVLVHVVNRQSFHWSLDMHLPLLQLAGLGATLVVAAALTAAASARSAMGHDVITAVRADG